MTARHWTAAVCVLVLGGFAGVGGYFYLRPPIEVRTCEAFVADRLAAPSTYRRVSWSASDENKRRKVILTYDAQNRMGVPLEDIEICTFKLFAGKPLEWEVGDVAVQSAMAKHLLWQARGGKGPPPECCID